jgi:hypothetical protein
MKQFIILFLSTFLFFIGLFAQHKYYFNASAAGEGRGTKKYPFKSSQKLSQLKFEPGDTVFFHGGDAFNGNIALANISGSKEHKVVFTSYGKKKGIINGENKEGLVISGGNYFEIINLSFVGTGRKAGNTTDGIRLANCRHVTIKDLDISGFQKSGLLCYNCEHIEVDGVYAHDNGFAGILVEGDYQKRISNNIHIINCRADNNPGDPANLTNHSGNGILAGNCKNVLIEYCTATNNGWDMPRVGNGPVGIWAYEADSVIIQYCIAYRNKTAAQAADGGGFDLDGGVSNSIIQYCLSYENYGSGYGIFEYNGADNWYNNTVRYCISINDGNVTDKACAMFIWNGENSDSAFHHFYAYNNFFYSDTKYVFDFAEQAQHRQFSFFNNIFVAADTTDIFSGADSSATDVFLGNVWMKKNGGFAQNGFTDIKKWTEATGYEQHNGKLTATVFEKKIFLIPADITITDPHALKTNAMLRSLCNAAVRNKGIEIVKIFGINTGKTDFFGNHIPLGNGFEPGVCEMK